MFRFQAARSYSYLFQSLNYPVSSYAMLPNSVPINVQGGRVACRALASLRDWTITWMATLTASRMARPDWMAKAVSVCRRFLARAAYPVAVALAI
eukprot:scaffold55754_cov32-Tisochrysis_lutea.AAC.2